MLNRLIGPLIVILIGLALTGFGFVNATEKVPECDYKEMHRGDTCRQAKGSPLSYEAQLRADHDMGRVTIGAGAAAVIGGVVLGIRNYRRRPEVPLQRASGGNRYHAQSGSPPQYPPPGMPQRYPPFGSPQQYPPPGGSPQHPAPQYPPRGMPQQYPPPQQYPAPHHPPQQHPPPGGPPQYPPPQQYRSPQHPAPGQP
ncbi:hypothetical protein [Mycobacterium asiaticum]|uniref:Uncharacterized protein n=1 Tax=Mycobacterium asiaticum TaxID=1790 RepID=A0A1A3CRF6_MYCAS|nr:hypothetical protein [Mycobacterium asiaticum]OBI88942.1 hypothetical protein A9X01_14460 [Mycobacterium asiaticum]